MNNLRMTPVTGLSLEQRVLRIERWIHDGHRVAELPDDAEHGINRCDCSLEARGERRRLNPDRSFSGPCSACCQLPDEVACWNCQAKAKAAKLVAAAKGRKKP